MHCFKAEIYKESIYYLVEVPYAITQILGSGKHIPVRGFAEGQRFKSTCVPRRGKKLALILNAPIRKMIRRGLGDPVNIEIEIDPENRDIPLPEDVEMILAEDETILKEFLSASPSNQREFTKYILDAKHEQTRLKRIYTLVQRMQERIEKRKHR